MSWKVLALCCIIATSLADDEINNKKFPKDFLFGTSSSSYQVEGAWNENGKGESIWDHFTHTNPQQINGNGNGDIACDSYHKYKEDVQLLKDLGVNHYLFSLSWSRILTNGTSDTINEDGINYYKNLIKELKDNDIEPFVTLYHWDLPEILEKQGGWVDNFIIEKFEDYARICFEQFGDDVKYWLTFNDPRDICLNGYGLGSLAPGVQENAILDYKCAHILLKSHARVWHMYDEEFRPTQDGKISIAIESSWFDPMENVSADIVAAETKLQFTFGWFGNPIFKGDYPDIMKTRIAHRSEQEYRRNSRLPAFTDDDVNNILGTQDFLAVNTYSTTFIEHPREEPEVAKPNYKDDVGVDEVGLLKVNPAGIRKLLNWLKNTYNNPEIFITGNGISDDGSSLNDQNRTNYYRDYLSNVRSAMDDGVNVIGYTARSFLDSFEWLSGYADKFGFYSVDFESENRTRTPKSSTEYFKKIISTRCLVDTCEES